MVMLHKFWNEALTVTRPSKVTVSTMAAGPNELHLSDIEPISSSQSGQTRAGTTRS
jgi:hypothetical protein